MYLDRNKVIHGIWGVSWRELYGETLQPELMSQTTIKSLRKGGKQMIREDVMVPYDIQQIADEIRSALLELLAIAAVLTSS